STSRSPIWRSARAGRLPLRSTARMRAASSAKSKRLCDVIVRTSVKPANTLFDHAGARDHYHRRIRPFGANSAQDVQPAGSRRIEIQDHEIVMLVGSQL